MLQQLSFLVAQEMVRDHSNLSMLKRFGKVSTVCTTVPQGQGSRLRARRYCVLLCHGRPSFPRKGPKSAIATWNLRRLGTRNWGETSWLKMKMLTCVALQRGWRSVFISDCGAEGKGTFRFKSFGGSCLDIFNGRCGVFLDPGMANMRRREERNGLTPQMALLWLLLFLAPVVVIVAVFFLLFLFMVLFQVLDWIPRDGSCSIPFLLFWVLFHLDRWGFKG